METTLIHRNKKLQCFIKERYYSITNELLSKKINYHKKLDYKFFNINFDNMLDEMVFVTLYDPTSSNILEKYILDEIKLYLYKLSRSELDFLLLKDIDIVNSDKNTRTDSYISNEIMKIISNQTIEIIASLAEEKYEDMTQVLIENLKSLSLIGVFGDGYLVDNYWDEFCIIVQEESHLHYYSYYNEIFDHIVSILKRQSDPVKRILYAGTEEMWNQDSTEPFFFLDLNSISEKLFEMIKFEASYAEIDNFYIEEDYDD
ncbi:hypothetical protein AABM38_11130 [Heyndrickxia sp. MSNUG]|uniref:hypothetical protein n=1 Tax=Heyndrickxia sp. MSNUG TaxID=3136677 RepID=UPI003C2B390D